MFINDIKSKMEVFFGFRLKNFTSFKNFVKLMYQPRHASGLGLLRILFGILMLLDLLFERSGLQILSRWGDFRDCHFPLFPQIRPPTFFVIGAIYGLMSLGALGITLGYKYKCSTSMYIVLYWYLLLLDKTYWNNHSYLFGLVSILLLGTSANSIYSVDSLLDSTKYSRTVPFWNYFILRFQFFILYFMAGLKKIDIEWLGGYAMDNLGKHRIFDPLKFILTSKQIDLVIVHWFGFLLDLTVGFWLLSNTTRRYAMLVCGLFHFMNSRLFSIGMFPYVCIITMPIFCNEKWPAELYNWFGNIFARKNIYADVGESNTKNVRTPLSRTATKHQRSVAYLLLLHCGLQLFLPYSHFITKGYNNWTNGLYGYSWDMMVHSWNSALVVVRVVDNEFGKEYFIDSGTWTQNQRWNKHADMCIQYARCLKENLISLNGTRIVTDDSFKTLPIISNNISIYIDVWCSLNGRFQQRMFDPNYDLLKANWSPFAQVKWLLPLMTESSEFRDNLKRIQDHVYSWSNYTDALFVADFPGMHLENYLTADLVNVTLTVLEGDVIYESENEKTMQSIGIKLKKGSTRKIGTGKFHKLHTVGLKPSLYMYTFVNQTEVNLDKENVKL